ncbi:MAG: beta-lactamase family protein [Candidatus Hydrogenedentes bacterium]|nr:beta-lactamase family protein [Candidatus Hydrogenedentota bacterium]
MRRRSAEFVLVWLLALAAPWAGAADETARLEARFEPALLEAMKEGPIPGVAVAVVRGTEVVYAKGFGVKNVERGEPVTADTLFHCASVTKTFVATAIVQLEEAGKLELGGTVQQYLPYFTLKDERHKAITIATLLNHSSGMPDVLNYHWDRPEFGDDALENYVRGLSKRKLLSAPGEKHRYSNIGYEILGDLIAKASGETFEAYVTQHILRPLGMKTSTLMMPEADPALLTTPHRVRGGAAQVSKTFPYNREHAPSSTLLSSAHELARWAMLHLNQGELDGVRILKAETARRMMQPLEPKFENAGISWFLGEYKGLRTVGHSGGDVGFRCHLMLVPEAALGIVVLTNGDGAPAPRLAQDALDALLD